MAAAAILDFRIFEILLAKGYGGLRCIITLNFVKICQSVVMIRFCAKFEVPTFTCYDNMKGKVSCKECNDLCA